MLHLTPEDLKSIAANPSAESTLQGRCEHDAISAHALEEENRRLGSIIHGQDSAMVLVERERIIALLCSGRVQVWLPEAGDLWPATADDLRKLLNP